MIYSLGNLRNTLSLLKVGYTSAKGISDILQCDVLHKNTLEGSEVIYFIIILDIILYFHYLHFKIHLIFF